MFWYRHILDYISPFPGVFVAQTRIPRIEETEVEVLITGFILIVSGVVINFLLFGYDHFNEISSRKRALRLRDIMIIPPRCDAKSRELGLMTGRDWRDYFVRDEPFVAE